MNKKLFFILLGCAFFFCLNLYATSKNKQFTDAPLLTGTQVVAGGKNEFFIVADKDVSALRKVFIAKPNVAHKRPVKEKIRAVDLAKMINKIRFALKEAAEYKKRPHPPLIECKSPMVKHDKKRQSLSHLDARKIKEMHHAAKLKRHLLLTSKDKKTVLSKSVRSHQKSNAI